MDTTNLLMKKAKGSVGLGESLPERISNQIGEARSGNSNKRCFSFFCFFGTAFTSSLSFTINIYPFLNNNKIHSFFSPFIISPQPTKPTCDPGLNTMFFLSFFFSFCRLVCSTHQKMREQRSESKTKPTWNYQLNRQL